MRVGVDVSYTPMSSPTGLTAATNAASGSLSGTYRYEVTAIDSAGGETTVASGSEVTQATGGSTPIGLYWNAVTGASGYNIYRTAAGGASGSEVYLTTVLSNYSSSSPFIDNGSITPGTASPPTTNTAYVSANSSNNDYANDNPIELNFWQNIGYDMTALDDSPANIGDVLVLTSGMQETGYSLASVSGGGVTSWTPVVVDSGDGSGNQTEMWIGTVTATGSNTITVSYDADPGTMNELTATEFSVPGVDSSTTWNVVASGSNDSSSYTTTADYRV